MNPFWNGLFEHFENCGRDATLFYCTVLGLVGVVVAVAVIGQTELCSYVRPALPWIGLLAAGWIYLAIRRASARGRERLQRGPLSDIELRKARRKLGRSRM